MQELYSKLKSNIIFYLVKKYVQIFLELLKTENIITFQIIQPDYGSLTNYFILFFTGREKNSLFIAS